MAYKTLIIDDEEPARKLVASYLSNHSQFEIAGEFSDGFSAMKAIQELKPDVVFLDIQMPKLTGIEMIELLEDPPVIIFTTAYDQYAIKAFEHSATDYLMKPFSRERFAEAIKKAELQLNGAYKEKTSSLLQYYEQQPEMLERVAIRDRGSIKVVSVRDIFYLKSEGDYVMIYTKEGNFLKEKTMKFFETHLSQKDFVRIHRSYLVRIDTITSIDLYEKDSYVVKIKNGDVLKASTTGYKTLKEALQL